MQTRPVAFTPAQLAAHRDTAVDVLDDARGVIRDPRRPAAAQLLLAAAISSIVDGARSAVPRCWRNAPPGAVLAVGLDRHVLADSEHGRAHRVAGGA